MTPLDQRRLERSAAALGVELPRDWASRPRVEIESRLLAGIVQRLTVLQAEVGGLRQRLAVLEAELPDRGTGS